MIRQLLSLLACLMLFLPQTGSCASLADSNGVVANPILPGFNPDPSICRVGDDYYLVTSSFMFFPGLPVYHSRDLAHWELIGHGVDQQNIDKFHYEGLTDNDGMWAPTIRHHDGTFYIVCTLHNGGGNFIITASDPRGPWSDPVWIPQASGIDPTLFWDGDGKAYYLGNRWDQPRGWTGQVAIWLQEIDLTQTVTAKVEERKTGLSFEAPTYKLKGKPAILAFGHAAEARYAEGPHLYNIGGRYCLLMAEGGSGKYHAVTAHWADSLRGPYHAQQVNPVLTHRHMGKRYGVQNVGHADLVTTPDGGLMAVCLANRMLPIPGQEQKPYVSPLGRETWLVDVELEDGQLIFAPGKGRLSEQLPLDGVQTAAPQADQLSGETEQTWYTPLTAPQLRLQKLQGLSWNTSRTIQRNGEEKGIVVFRTVNSYYSLCLEKQLLVLKKMEKAKEQTVAEMEWKGKSVTLRAECDGLTLRFFADGQQVGPDQSMLPLCDDGKYNKFNGTGVGYILVK